MKKTRSVKIPIRYLPSHLKRSDKKKQISMLKKSRTLYKKKEYYTRKKLKTFKSKPSNHVTTAKQMYKVDTIKPNKKLSIATGCSLSSLRKIVRKGEGAYFSSGSRPNQTAQSWGIARLASSITGGKSAAVDFNILEKGCNHNKRAFRLARKSKRINGFGHSKTKKVKVSM
jgi:hypothetical protein